MILAVLVDAMWTGHSANQSAASASFPASHISRSPRPAIFEGRAFNGTGCDLRLCTIAHSFTLSLASNAARSHSPASSRIESPRARWCSCTCKTSRFRAPRTFAQPSTPQAGNLSQPSIFDTEETPFSLTTHPGFIFARRVTLFLLRTSEWAHRSQNARGTTLWLLEAL